MRRTLAQNLTPRPPVQDEQHVDISHRTRPAEVGTVTAGPPEPSIASVPSAPLMKPVQVRPVAARKGVPDIQSRSVPSVMNVPLSGSVNYSPNLETFPSLGESYFALASAAFPSDDWSQFPATQDVDMDGYGLYEVRDVTFTGGNVLDASGTRLEVNNDGIVVLSDLVPITMAILDISGRVHTLETDVFDISGRVHTLELDVSGLKVDVLDISGRVHQAEIDISGLQGDVLDISGRVHVLEGDISGAIIDISGLQHQVTDISGRVHQTELDISGLQGDVFDISGRVHTLEGEIVDVSNNITNWSKYPAVSDVSLNGFDLVGAYSVYATRFNQPYTFGVGNFFGNELTIGDTSPIYTGGLTVNGPVTLDGGTLHGTSIGCQPVAGINTVRIDVLPVGTIDLVCPAAMTLDAGGAANIAAGGAVSIAAGSYIEVNSGELQVVNSTSAQSLMSVNTIRGNTYFGANGRLTLDTPHIKTGLDMSGNPITAAASIGNAGGRLTVIQPHISGTLDMSGNTITAAASIGNAGGRLTVIQPHISGPLDMSANVILDVSSVTFSDSILTNKQTNTVTIERVGSANLGTLRANAINFSSNQTDDDTTFFKRTSDDRVGVIPPTGPQTAVAYLSDISGTTLNLNSINTVTPLVTLIQVQVTVPASTANMSTGPQFIGTTASGNYSIGGHHVTTNGIISSTKITVPNVYTYVSAGNWYWAAEVSGSTSNTSEVWTVVIVFYSAGTSAQSGVVGP